ncbi:uncharacterized protein DAT39_004564 [Clarias magur]|uniref:Uncharacterized protein n=1 Tax=Clarias magur TaxID=1594786 RepID=A0A8J4UCB0_CLAMG|nr:uncharacterized protein DAT39_004564 [Clarias magur]
MVTEIEGDGVAAAGCSEHCQSGMINEWRPQLSLTFGEPRRTSAELFDLSHQLDSFVWRQIGSVFEFMKFGDETKRYCALSGESVCRNGSYLKPSFNLELLGCANTSAVLQHKFHHLAKCASSPPPYHPHSM